MLKQAFALTAFLGFMISATGVLLVFSVREDFHKLNELILSNADNTIIYSDRGEVIGELFDQYRIWTPFNKLPQNLVDAIIAIEDQKFFTHKGIDPKAILRAAIANLKSGKVKQGASTLTQQLVRNHFLRKEKSLKRKIKETLLSLNLEIKMSKEDIFELYTNTLFLGDGAYGVAAAAKRYFGLELKSINLSQAALIAGLFQQPGALNPRRNYKNAIKRRNTVLKTMFHGKFITLDQYREAVRHKIKLKPYSPSRLEFAPHFVDAVEKKVRPFFTKHKGLRVFTTLDISKQENVHKTFSKNKTLFKKADRWVLSKKEKAQAAFMIIDPKSGAILAMQGSRDYNKSKFNRTLQSLRSPGSSFKTFVYAKALVSGFEWSDVLFTSPIAVGNYRPKNFDKHQLSQSTLLRAYYKSQNTPTILLGEKIGVQPIIEFAQKLGVKTPLKKEAGTLLGGSDMSMIDLASSYGVIANGGTQVLPHMITRIETKEGKILYKRQNKAEKRLLSKKHATLIQLGMREVLRRGTAAKAGKFSYAAAGKTGTSNNSVDNWFIGYTQDQLILSWVGTDKRSPMIQKATGSSLALPLFIDYLERSEFTPLNINTAGLQKYQVDSRYGNLSDRGITMFTLKPPVNYHYGETAQGFRNIMSY